MPQHQQLLEHQDFLRRLAAGLVRDAQSAEDLVQDTLLTGLRRPPRHSGNLRAWLGRVLVNRARSKRRTALRRTQREEQVAQPEAWLLDGQAMERIELQRALLNALAALPEATRTTMVLRYYDGLSPLAIAARLGAPHETIKSRLQRGLEAMRRELDRGQEGGREGWALALAPLTERTITPAATAAGSTAVTTAWLGATIMTTTKWAGVGALVLLGAMVAMLTKGDEPELHRTGAAMPAGDKLAAIDPQPGPDASRPLAAIANMHEPRADVSTTPPAAQAPTQKSLPALIVRDQDSGAGIEDFTLLSRDLSGDRLRDQGLFHAPGGRLTASSDPGLIAYGDGSRSFTVWAPGYGARTVIEENFGSFSEVVIELKRGDLPSVRGVVMDTGVPIAGAQVSLCPYRKLDWQPGDLSALVEGATDQRGAFELGAAAGQYVLRVQAGVRVILREVELPADDSLTIDLGTLGTMSLLVRDTAGEPLPDIIGILRRIDDHSRNERHETDGEGRAVFSNVEPGEWLVSLHGTMEHFHGTPWVERRFTLTPGKKLELELTTPAPDEPRRARLVVDGGTPQGWHTQGLLGKERAPVAADGRLEIDPNSGSMLLLRSPVNLVWNWSIPPYAPDEGVLEIRVPSAPSAYRGHIVSRVDGAPIACEVFCYVRPIEGGFNTVSTTTDAAGRFVLPIPGDAATALHFRIDGSPGGDYFKPNYPPADSPALELRLYRNNAYRTDRRMTLTPVTGRVTEASDGSAIMGGYVRIQAFFDDPHGSYGVGIDSSSSVTGPDGRYSVQVPVADRYSIFSADKWAEGARTISEDKGRLVQGEKAVWDLVLPSSSK